MNGLENPKLEHMLIESIRAARSLILLLSCDLSDRGREGAALSDKIVLSRRTKLNLQGGKCRLRR